MKKILFTLAILLGGLVGSFAQIEISGYLDSDPTDGINNPPATFNQMDAVNACRNLVHKGNNDWYLPSFEELMLFTPATTSAVVPGCTGLNCDVSSVSGVHYIRTRSTPKANDHHVDGTQNLAANYFGLCTQLVWYGAYHVRCVR